MPKPTLSLEEEFEAAIAEQTKGPSCGVKIAMGQMTEKDQLALQNALKGNRLHATIIHEKLAARKVECPVLALRRHRRMLRGESGGCECRPIQS